MVRGWNRLEHGFAALMVQLPSVCSQLALSILSEPQIMMVVISNLELKEILSGSDSLGFLSCEKKEGEKKVAWSSLVTVSRVSFVSDTRGSGHLHLSPGRTATPED